MSEAKYYYEKIDTVIPGCVTTANMYRTPDGAFLGTITREVHMDFTVRFRTWSRIDEAPNGSPNEGRFDTYEDAGEWLIEQVENFEKEFPLGSTLLEGRTLGQINRLDFV